MQVLAFSVTAAAALAAVWRQQGEMVNCGGSTGSGGISSSDCGGGDDMDDSDVVLTEMDGLPETQRQPMMAALELPRSSGSGSKVEKLYLAMVAGAVADEKFECTVCVDTLPSHSPSCESGQQTSNHAWWWWWWWCCCC